MAELSLSERIVHAAETAIEESRSCMEVGGFGNRVEGFTVDFARSAAAAVLEVLAEVAVPKGDAAAVLAFMELAQQVRDVPALKAV